MDDLEQPRGLTLERLVGPPAGAGGRRRLSGKPAVAYAPTGDRVKEEDAALFTDAPPPLGGAVAAIVEHEQRVTGTAAGCTLKMPRQRLSRRSSGAPGIYNVVDDEPAPQPEWLPVLAQALRADPPALAEMLPPPDTPVMSLRGASNARARRELGWRPRYASWREGFPAGLA